jgi:hypothetical protein
MESSSEHGLENKKDPSEEFPIFKRKCFSLVLIEQPQPQWRGA